MKEDEKIDKAITKTVEFFESMGIRTKLPDYDVRIDTINKIAERFEKRDSKLGENSDIDYKAAEAILKDRL